MLHTDCTIAIDLGRTFSSHLGRLSKPKRTWWCRWLKWSPFVPQAILAYTEGLHRLSKITYYLSGRHAVYLLSLNVSWSTTSKKELLKLREMQRNEIRVDAKYSPKWPTSECPTTIAFLVLVHNRTVLNHKWRRTSIMARYMVVPASRNDSYGQSEIKLATALLWSLASLHALGWNISLSVEQKYDRSDYSDL